MKRLLIILSLLGVGCGAEKPKAPAVVIDTTPEYLIVRLAKLGYDKVVITGRRTEDCQNNDAIVGYGVKVRVGPNIISGVICQDTIKRGYWFVPDDKREEFSWAVIDEKLMGF